MAYRAALATAVENALAEPQPLAVDVDWTDVFTIRHIFFDPALKGVIDSNWTSEKGRQKLMKTIGELLLEQPHFPLGYHDLLFRKSGLFVSRPRVIETLFVLFLLVISFCS